MDPASFVLQASAAVGVVGILTTLTALALSSCLKRNHDVDSLFWYGFCGLSAVVFAIAGAAATIPGSAFAYEEQQETWPGAIASQNMA